MGEVMNTYRAKRGKGKRPSRLMARTRVGVRSYALAVSEITGAA